MPLSIGFQLLREQDELEDFDMTPDEEDAFLYPTGSLGGQVGVSVGGKHLGVFDDNDEAEAALREWMETNQFWPNIWWQDDHGGYTPYAMNESAPRLEGPQIGAVEGSRLIMVEDAPPTSKIPRVWAFEEGGAGLESQYNFPGGEDVYTGIGDNPREAALDATNQAEERGWDVTDIRNDAYDFVELTDDIDEAIRQDATGAGYNVDDPNSMEDYYQDVDESWKYFVTLWVSEDPNAVYLGRRYLDPKDHRNVEKPSRYGFRQESRRRLHREGLFNTRISGVGRDRNGNKIANIKVPGERGIMAEEYPLQETWVEDPTTRLPLAYTVRWLKKYTTLYGHTKDGQKVYAHNDTGSLLRVEKTPIGTDELVDVPLSDVVGATKPPQPKILDVYDNKQKKQFRQVHSQVRRATEDYQEAQPPRSQPVAATEPDEEASEPTVREKIYTDAWGNPTGMGTPWGKADGVRQLARGVVWVNTPSHGGLGVTVSLAQKALSPNARAQGEQYGSYLWYEEDVAWAIPFHEHPEWEEVLVALSGNDGNPTTTPEQKLDIIQRHFPDYLKANAYFDMDSLQPGDILNAASYGDIDRIDKGLHYVGPYKSKGWLLASKDGTTYKWKISDLVRQIISVERNGETIWQKPAASDPDQGQLFEAAAFGGQQDYSQGGVVIRKVGQDLLRADVRPVDRGFEVRYSGGDFGNTKVSYDNAEEMNQEVNGFFQPGALKEDIRDPIPYAQGDRELLQKANKRDYEAGRGGFRISFTYDDTPEALLHNYPSAIEYAEDENTGIITAAIYVYGQGPAKEMEDLLLQDSYVDHVSVSSSTDDIFQTHVLGEAITPMPNEREEWRDGDWVIISYDNPRTKTTPGVPATAYAVVNERTGFMDYPLWSNQQAYFDFPEKIPVKVRSAVDRFLRDEMSTFHQPMTEAQDRPYTPGEKEPSPGPGTIAHAFATLMSSYVGGSGPQSVGPADLAAHNQASEFQTQSIEFGVPAVCIVAYLPDSDQIVVSVYQGHAGEGHPDAALIDAPIIYRVGEADSAGGDLQAILSGLDSDAREGKEPVTPKKSQGPPPPPAP